ncbi:four-carbon acid sugar kinase family protein [Paenibacillus sp. HB172176]|uniref:four-carbon acid sugar kinase family protein n=1 Tax=Paenibacillus sp. HB172176 TaxID=2493690 RepID=UPI00143AE02C|nr:four-carbon acid sugar kinase family protein [Paenibacillus sp. HB172176]
MVERLLCYYGDDFTGSTDVLEALFRTGLRTVLFLEPPDPQLLQGKFRDADCFGVAGVGRSLSPHALELELRPILETLREANAAIMHYKICSTFDSSPETGSIGKAIEIGREVFRDRSGGMFTPLLVGVPYLRRYTLFGHHFAGSGAEVHRLDRHPVMMKHPVTPMVESDLRLHLGKQTDLRMALLDIEALDGDQETVNARLERIIQEQRPDIVLFDALDEKRLEAAGQAIWKRAAGGEGLFVAGSSGVEYALASAWRAEGLAPAEGAMEAEAGSVDKLLVVSGSCSSVTEKQISHALKAGFAGIRVPGEELLLPEQREAALAGLRRELLRLLEAGRSVILYSALGPQDASIGKLREALARQGLRAEDSSRLLGEALGRLTREMVAEAGLSRIVIAGGDTSGYITRELGLYALECVATLEPGGPLCRAHAHDLSFDGLELVLKGGQVGGEAFFERVRRGERARAGEDQSGGGKG